MDTFFFLKFRGLHYPALNINSIARRKLEMFRFNQLEPFNPFVETCQHPNFISLFHPYLGWFRRARSREGNDVFGYAEGGNAEVSVNNLFDLPIRMMNSVDVYSSSIRNEEVNAAFLPNKSLNRNKRACYVTIDGGLTASIKVFRQVLSSWPSAEMT